MTYQIFISLRFAEARPEAEALKRALEKRGISTFLCAVQSGEDIKREIVKALHGCQLAIIMGTRTYGKDTGAKFSTFEELRFIINELKPFFLVKMCDRFDEAETRFSLGDSVMYFQWLPDHPIPEDLVPEIVEKLASITPSSAPVGSALNDRLAFASTELEKLRSMNRLLKSSFFESNSKKTIDTSKHFLQGLDEETNHKPLSATIPLESLAENESIELLIHLGCSAEVRKRVKELDIGMDGGYLQGIDEVELLQELEDNSSRLRKPVLNGILTKLKKFQENGIPSDISNGVKQRIEEEKRRKQAEEKRIREEELRRKAEQEAKQRAEEEKRIREEELRRKAEQEAILAKHRAEEKRLAEPPITLSGHRLDVYSVIQLSDGRLASGSMDHTVKIWNVINGTCERTLSGPVCYVIQLADGRLASGSYHTVKIWNVTNGTCERTLSGHSSFVRSVIQLADGRLASGSDDKTVKIWNVATGTCERTLSGHMDSVLSVIQLSDGRLASGSGDKTVKIWNVATGTCERTLSGHSNSVWSVIQLADGRLASGSYDKTVKIWNVDSGACERTLSGHSSRSVIQLADGRLASGSRDKTVKIWNVATGTCERTLSGHRSCVYSVIQLADGRLASGSRDKTVKIWNI
jgi:hypothetical protein